MTTRLTLLAAFVAAVIAANVALDHLGLLTVWPWPWLQAPAGVLFAGATFGLRDALHERASRWWILAAITLGAGIAYVMTDHVTLPGGRWPLAAASAAAFALSELADWSVYSRLDRWGLAVFWSNTVGAVIDSALFLWLAFGSFDHMAGNVVGKLLMVAPALVLVWRVRAVPRYRLRPAGT